MRRIGQAAKETGQSPEFIQGALTAAIPATLGTLYLYGTRSGKEIRERLPEGTREKALRLPRKELVLARKKDEVWREQHPYRFAGLVALGAAMSGGILTKLFSDLRRVL